MKEKTVKLERKQTTPYHCCYISPNGRDYEEYTWNGSRRGYRNIVEVPKYVYNWLRYNTNALAKGNLVLVQEGKNDVKDVVKAVKAFTYDETVELLKGNISKLKKEINEKTPKHIIDETIRIANAINLDSSSKREYLAGLIGHKDNVEFVFPRKED